MDELRSEGRRHSLDVSLIASMANSNRRVSFTGQGGAFNMQFHSRRHSVMAVPQQSRRMSMDPRAGGRRQSRRMSLLPFAGYGMTTFSGLPIAAKPVIKQENTYKMAPDEGTEFKSHKVRKVAQEALEDVLEESDYMMQKLATTGVLKGKPRDLTKQLPIPTAGGQLAKQLVTATKDRLKTLKMDRYKFVVNAFVGECKGQDLVIASRSLWDTSTDGHITVQHKTSTHYAVVVVHAVYYE